MLAEHYRTSEPLTFTRTMLWDMEVLKAWRPDRYIPAVVREGSAHTWGPRRGRGFSDGLLRTDVDAFLTVLRDQLAERLHRAGCRPSSTLLGVTRLAFPEMLVEIEATAVA